MPLYIIHRHAPGRFGIYTGDAYRAYDIDIDYSAPIYLGMQPANATESDARLALYLCVDIFLIFLIFSYFPIFHRLRFPFHDDGRVSLLLLFQFTLGAAQLKLLFINLATFTHSLKDCVAIFVFSSRFFLLDHSESGREENHVRLGALSKENCLAAVKIFLCRDFPSHRIA